MLKAKPATIPTSRNAGAVPSWRSRNRPSTSPPTSPPTTLKPNSTASAAARQAPPIHDDRRSVAIARLREKLHKLIVTGHHGENKRPPHTRGAGVRRPYLRV